MGCVYFSIDKCKYSMSRNVVGQVYKKSVSDPQNISTAHMYLQIHTHCKSSRLLTHQSCHPVAGFKMSTL